MISFVRKNSAADAINQRGIEVERRNEKHGEEEEEEKTLSS